MRVQVHQGDLTMANGSNELMLVDFAVETNDIYDMLVCIEHYCY